MERSKVFKNNQTQAVRLPKAVALPDQVRTVEIVKLGKSRLISPEGGSWDSWFAGPAATSDFMNDRDQSDDQERDAL